MSPEQLTEHLTTFSQERLITEVMTMWTELGEMERSLAMSRQRARALDSELRDCEHVVLEEGMLQNCENGFEWRRHEERN